MDGLASQGPHGRGPGVEEVLLEGCARLCQEGALSSVPKLLPYSLTSTWTAPRSPCCRHGADGGRNGGVCRVGQVLQDSLHRAALAHASRHAWHASHMEVCHLKYILKFCCLTKGRHPYAEGSFLPGPNPRDRVQAENRRPAPWAESCMQGTHLDTRPLTHAHTHTAQQAGPSPAQSLAQLPPKHTTYRGTNTYRRSPTHNHYCRGPKTHIRV